MPFTLQRWTQCTSYLAVHVQLEFSLGDNLLDLFAVGSVASLSHALPAVLYQTARQAGIGIFFLLIGHHVRRIVQR